MTGFSLAGMPLRNLSAHPVRSLILLLLAAAQAVCVLVGMALATSSKTGLSLAEERLGADIMVYPYAAAYKMDMDTLIMQGTPVEAWASRSNLERMKDCDGIAAMSCQVYLPGIDGGPAWVVGFEPETDFVLAPWIEEGRHFALPAGTALVGCDVAASDGSVELYGRKWPVGAHLAKTGSELDGYVFLSTADLSTAAADATSCGVEAAAGIDPLRDYSVVLVRVDNKDNVESVANWLKVYLRKTKTVQSDEALTVTASSISWQSVAVGGMAAVAWLVLLGALAVAQSMAMRERTAELYVWRAAGASRKVIRHVVLGEAVIVHALGAAVGALLASCVIALLLPSGGPTLMTMLLAGLLSIGLSIMAGCLSAGIAVRRVIRPDGQMLVAR